MYNLMDGKQVSQLKRIKIKEDAEAILTKFKKQVGLAVIIVGENSASKVYVSNKIKACQETAIKSFSYDLPENTSEGELIQLVENLNNNVDVNGILVQLPLPKHINSQNVLSKIRVEKDVDGFSANQIGKLTLGENELVACTPNGVMELFKFYNISLCGKNAVVIGRSNIVGKPMALLMLQQNATVTICHSKTANMDFYLKNADIVVVAIGVAKFLKADSIKDGAVIVDVGMNRDENGKLCGDVDFETVKNKSSYITPVPGGVGPMTITMLMENTIRAFKNQNGG